MMSPVMNQGGMGITRRGMGMTRGGMGIIRGGMGITRGGIIPPQLFPIGMTQRVMGMQRGRGVMGRDSRPPKRPFNQPMGVAHGSRGPPPKWFRADESGLFFLMLTILVSSSSGSGSSAMFSNFIPSVDGVIAEASDQ